MLRRRQDRIRGIAGSLDGSVIYVADAAAQAGPGTVRVLAHAGAAVAAASHDAPTLDVQLAKLNPTAGPITAVYQTDSFGFEAITEPADSVVINPPSSASHSELDSYIEFANEVATTMQDRGHSGSIVFISGIRRSGIAGASAARLQAEMQDLARRLAPNAIRVNTVAVGPVETNRRDRTVTSRATPLGHVSIHPVDVGKAVWFLINSELSSAITGTTLTVDRGASLLAPDW